MQLDYTYAQNVKTIYVPTVSDNYAKETVAKRPLNNIVYTHTVQVTTVVDVPGCPMRSGTETWKCYTLANDNYFELLPQYGDRDRRTYSYIDISL